MAFFDLPEEQLRCYRPPIAEPDDFDAFWQRTFAEHGSADLGVCVEPVETHMALVDAFDVSYAGYDGQRVHAWLLLPHGTGDPLPAVVQYTGYSVGRGMPHDKVNYVVSGYAHFVFDARGQGWATPSAAPSTPDDASRTGGVRPGVMTEGILDADRYYYRRLFVDAARLVEVAAAHELVDPARIAVAGGSQGGGLALAAGALAPLRGVTAAACSAEVPFLCHFDRAVGLTDAYPYKEIADFLAVFPQHRDQVMTTLGYFDGVSMAARATGPGLFSVGLMDTTCPPSTVFAAYNAYGEGAAGGTNGGAPEKDIVVYPFNGHEGGTSYQVARIIGWLNELLRDR